MRRIRCIALVSDIYHVSAYHDRSSILMFVCRQTSASSCRNFPYEARPLAAAGAWGSGEGIVHVIVSV